MPTLSTADREQSRRAVRRLLWGMAVATAAVAVACGVAGATAGPVAALVGLAVGYAAAAAAGRHRWAVGPLLWAAVLGGLLDVTGGLIGLLWFTLGHVHPTPDVTWAGLAAAIVAWMGTGLAHLEAVRLLLDVRDVARKHRPARRGFEVLPVAVPTAERAGAGDDPPA